LRFSNAGQFNRKSKIENRKSKIHRLCPSVLDWNCGSCHSPIIRKQTPLIRKQKPLIRKQKTLIRKQKAPIRERNPLVFDGFATFLTSCENAGEKNYAVIRGHDPISGRVHRSFPVALRSPDVPITRSPDQGIVSPDVSELVVGNRARFFITAASTQGKGLREER
jgi:hypothetical protein